MTLSPSLHLHRPLFPTILTFIFITIIITIITNCGVAHAANTPTHSASQSQRHSDHHHHHHDNVFDADSLSQSLQEYADSHTSMDHLHPHLFANSNTSSSSTTTTSDLDASSVPLVVAWIQFGSFQPMNWVLQYLSHLKQRNGPAAAPYDQPPIMTTITSPSQLFPSSIPSPYPPPTLPGAPICAATDPTGKPPAIQMIRGDTYIFNRRPIIFISTIISHCAGQNGNSGAIQTVINLIQQFYVSVVICPSSSGAIGCSIGAAAATPPALAIGTDASIDTFICDSASTAVIQTAIQLAIQTNATATTAPTSSSTSSVAPTTAMIPTTASSWASLVAGSTGWMSPSSLSFLKSMCRKTNDRLSSVSFGVNPMGSTYADDYVGLLASNNMRSIAVITDISQRYNIDVGNGAIQRAIDLRMAVYPITLDNSVVMATFNWSDPWLTDPRNPYSKCPSPYTINILNITQQLQQLKPDSVFLASGSCCVFLVLWKQLNYFPKSMASLNCPEQGNEVFMGDLIRYISAPVAWDARAVGSSYSDVGLLAPNFVPSAQNNHTPSAMLFSNEYLARFGSPPNAQTAANFAAMTYLENAILQANTSITQPPSAALLSALQTFYQSSFWGLLSSGPDGQNQQDRVLFIQRDAQNVVQLISPLQCATSNFIVPAPNWSDRIYVQVLFARSDEIAVIVLAVICSVVILTLTMLLYYFRDHPMIRATAPYVCMVMALGGMLMNLSTLTWLVENNSSMCQARLWTFTTAYHLFLDPLITKSFRIVRIFNMRSLQMKSGLSDASVLSQAAILFAPQLVLNIIWSAVNSPSTTRIVVDPLRPATHFTGCSFNTTTEIFVIISLVYAAALLILGCWLGLRVRRAAAMFNDATAIVLSMYTVALAAVVITALQLSIASPFDNDSQLNNVTANSTTNSALGSAYTAVFLLRSIGVLIAVQSSVCILLGDRLFVALYTNRDEMSRGGETKLSRESKVTAARNLSSRPNNLISAIREYLASVNVALPDDDTLLNKFSHPAVSAQLLETGGVGGARRQSAASRPTSSGGSGGSGTVALSAMGSLEKSNDNHRERERENKDGTADVKRKNSIVSLVGVGSGQPLFDDHPHPQHNRHSSTVGDGDGSFGVVEESTFSVSMMGATVEGNANRRGSITHSPMNNNNNNLHNNRGSLLLPPHPSAATTHTNIDLVISPPSHAAKSSVSPPSILQLQPPSALPNSPSSSSSSSSSSASSSSSSSSSAASNSTFSFDQLNNGGIKSLAALSSSSPPSSSSTSSSASSPNALSPSNTIDTATSATAIQQKRPLRWHT